MQDPLPAPPQGGYYVVEVTTGFVNDSFSGNTIDLTGKSSTAIKLDGEDYGTLITGNHIIGGTTYDDGYNGSAIMLGSAIGSGASGTGAFPLSWGWTALPNLGSVVTDNTIQDSLGGIIIGVEHGVDYWAAAGRQRLGDRARLPDGDRDREYVRIRCRFPAGLGDRLRRRRKQSRRELDTRRR